MFNIKMYCTLYIVVFFIIIISYAIHGILKRKTITGGTIFNKHPVLIIDVANMFVGWYMEKFQQKTPHLDAQQIVLMYINFMKDHYKKFVKINSHAKIMYVMKNYRRSRGSAKPITADPIKPHIWQKLYDFVKNHPKASITMAVDYTKPSYEKWTCKSKHYLRGRDDYMLFYTARKLKKAYTKCAIMTEDNFKDFTQFGFVSPFKTHYINNENGKVITTVETIHPRPNILGHYDDYLVVKVNVDFDFNDKKSIYAPSTPGKVWGFH